MEEQKTLLQAATERSSGRLNKAKGKAKLVEECELMFAYLDGSISSDAIIEVVGGKHRWASTWANGVILKGIKHGVLKLSMNRESR